MPKASKPARPGNKRQPVPLKNAAAAPAPKSPHRVYVISDSTGNLARHMMAAFCTQFPKESFETCGKSFVETTKHLDLAFDEIRRSPGVVLHAMVDPALKRRTSALCKELKLKSCDLTGPFIAFLSEATGVAPAHDRKRLHDVDAAYDLRIKAVEFTLEHDDGLGLPTIHEADVVVCGVSRTSKTPTSIYLSQQGFKVANVSLAIDVAPPLELLSLPRDRVAALVIDATQLSEIRTRRQVAWQMATTDYNRMDRVRDEILWSKRLFARQGWAVFDVTDQAIEETAARIVERLKLNERVAPTGLK